MLKCENVVKKYYSTVAVSDISVDIMPGKTYALLGPNGSGKTTLMKMIAGLSKPTSGSITIDNIPIGTSAKAHVAYMPTENFFYSYMGIKQIQKYFTDFYEDFDPALFQTLLKELDLNSTAKAKDMSSGMVAKLKIAVTMARHAYIILLDEPLNGVDIIARDKIVNVLTTYKKPNTTLIISSHLVDELEKMIDSAVFIKEGIVVAAGDAQELRNNNQMSIVDLYKKIYA